MVLFDVVVVYREDVEEVGVAMREGLELTDIATRFSCYIAK